MLCQLSPEVVQNCSSSVLVLSTYRLEILVHHLVHGSSIISLPSIPGPPSLYPRSIAHPSPDIGGILKIGSYLAAGAVMTDHRV